MRFKSSATVGVIDTYHPTFECSMQRQMHRSEKKTEIGDRIQILNHTPPTQKFVFFVLVVKNNGHPPYDAVDICYVRDSPQAAVVVEQKGRRRGWRRQLKRGLNAAEFDDEMSGFDASVTQVAPVKGLGWPQGNDSALAGWS